MKNSICLAAVLGLWAAAPAAAQEAPSAASKPEAAALETEGFRVIVNADNAIRSMERTRVSKMFLKKVRTWPEAEMAVKLVDQNEKAAVREAFTRAIHKKKVSAIKSYWQRMTFSGRDVPWPELGSDRSVIDFVRDNPGAMGYVSPDSELGDGVKELPITE